MMPAYTVIETGERVGDGKPELVTRFARRALRRRDKLNARRLVPFYRYEVVIHEETGRWAVIAFQNRAKPTPVLGMAIHADGTTEGTIGDV